MTALTTFWESFGGSFALSASGDTMLLYCRLENENMDDDSARIPSHYWSIHGRSME